jgi:GNAT superfamily N-acetyltransferase
MTEKRGDDTAGTWSVQLAKDRDQRERIFRFRYDSYLTTFGKRPSQGVHERRLLREVADEGALLLYAELDYRVTGTIRLQAGSVSAELWPGLSISRFRSIGREALGVADQLVVARIFRNTALADDLVRAACAAADERGIRFLFFHCRAERVADYARFGFRPYRESFREPELGDRMPLVRVARGGEDARWLERAFADERSRTRFDTATRQALQPSRNFS